MSLLRVPCQLWDDTPIYGVATVSTIDKMIGLFCRIASLLQVSFAKETFNFIDPTNCSHPITRPPVGNPATILLAAADSESERLARHIHVLLRVTCRVWEDPPIY